MPRFTVIKNGVRIKEVNSSGNLQALCDALGVSGKPEFYMHVHEGLLFAKVAVDIYMVFESEDNHAKNIANKVMSSKTKRVKKQNISTIARSFLGYSHMISTKEVSYVV